MKGVVGGLRAFLRLQSSRVMACTASEASSGDAPPSIEFDSHVMDIAFHSQHNCLAAAEVTGLVSVFNYATDGNSNVFTSNLHADSCRSLQFSGDGSHLWSGSSDGSLVRTALGGSSGSTACSDWRSTNKAGVSSLLSVGDQCVVSGYDSGVVKLWDVRQKKPVRSITEQEDYIADLLLHSDGRTLLSSSGDGTLAVLDISTGKLIALSDNMEDELLSLAPAKGWQKVKAFSVLWCVA